MANKPRHRPVASTVRRSRTILGALSALGASLGAFFHEAVSVAVQAASEFALLAPVASLGAALGLETRTVMLSLAVAGIGLSMYARLHDAAKGVNAKP